MLPRVMNARSFSKLARETRPNVSKLARETASFRRSVMAAAIGLFSIFALSGCIKMDIALSLDGDTVNGTMIVGVDKQILELSGQSKDELVGDLTEDVPETEGVTTEPYEDDTFVGTKFTLTDVSLNEFNNDASSSSDDLQITHDNDAGQYKVSGVLDLSEASGEGPGAELADNLDIKIAITFPGRVISHNGELDGTTVTWRPKAGEKLTMEAIASDASSFNWLLVVGIAVPILLLIAGLVVWFFLRGRSSGAPVPGEPALAGYPGGAAYPTGPTYPGAAPAPTEPQFQAGPAAPQFQAGPAEPQFEAAPAEPQFEAAPAWTPVSQPAPSDPAPAPPQEPPAEPPTRFMPPVQPPGNP